MFECNLGVHQVTLYWSYKDTTFIQWCMGGLAWRDQQGKEKYSSILVVIVCMNYTERDREGKKQLVRSS